ncbi:PAS domain-containing protein [Algoriphagus taiwanensis]
MKSSAAFQWIEYIHVPLVITHSDLQIIQCNRVFLCFFGVEEDQVLSKSLKEFFPSINKDHWTVTTNHFSELFSNDEKIRLASESLPGGELVWTITIIPENESFSILRNRALELAKLGFWSYDVESQKLIHDPQTKIIHGILSSENLVVDEAINFYAEGYSREKIRILFDTCIKKGEPFDGEFDFYDLKGNKKRVRAMGEAFFNGSKVIKVFGSFQDITESHERTRKIEMITSCIPGLVLEMKSSRIGYQINYINNSCINYWGFSSEEIVKTQDYFWQHLSLESRVNLELKLNQSKSDGLIFSCLLELTIDLQNIKYLRGTWAVRKEKDGYCWDAVLIDHTQEVLAEKSSFFSQHRFLNLVNNIDGLVFTLDKNLRFTGFHGNLLKSFQFNPERALGIKVDGLTGPAEAKIHRTAYEDCLRGEKVSYDWDFNEGKEKRWLRVSLAPLLDKNGIPCEVVGLANEVTERIRFIQELEKANIRFELAVKATREVIYEIDLKENEIILKGSTKRIFGSQCNGNPISFQDWRNRIHANDSLRINEQLEEFLKIPDKFIWKGAYRLLTNKNKYVHVKDRAFVQRNSNGEALRIFGSVQIVEKEYILKRKLLKSLRRLQEFRNALDSSTNIIITNREGYIEYVNDSTCELSGYTRQELIGKHTRINKSDFHNAEFYQQLWRKILNLEEWRGVLKNKRKDGTYYWVDTIIVPLKNSKGEAKRFLAVRIDITNQQEAQIQLQESFLKLQESETKYSDLFQNSPIPMWIYDQKTYSILDVNLAAQKNYGYSRPEFLELDIFDLRPKEEAETLQKYLQASDRNRYIRGKIFIHKKKSGEKMEVEISSISIKLGNSQSRLVLAKDVTLEKAYLRKIESQNTLLREIAWIQSHVVRAPLARLMGLISLLKDPEIIESEKEEIFKFINSSAEELDQIIRDISDKTHLLD